jgi:hypothetical protein
MTRRVLAFVLALTIASGTQGTLMYAAAAATGVRMVTDQAVERPVVTGPPAAALPGADALENMLTESAVECLRGAHACFGYFSYNCCAEIAAASAIAGAIGAWLAAGVGAYYYWHYC